MRDLGQDAGAVAGLVVRGGAAMCEPGDGGEGLREDVVGAVAVGPRDEADAAGVALAPGVEQTKSPLGCGSGLAGFGFAVHAIAPRRSLERVCREYSSAAPSYVYALVNINIRTARNCASGEVGAQHAAPLRRQPTRMGST